MTPLLYSSFIVALAITEVLHGIRYSQDAAASDLYPGLSRLIWGLYSNQRVRSTGNSRTETLYWYQPRMIMRVCLEDAGELWLSYWAGLAVFGLLCFFFIILSAAFFGLFLICGTLWACLDSSELV